MGGVYGSNDTANSANVNFDFNLALQAARDLYALSKVVTSTEQTRAGAATQARPEWSGHNRDVFDQKMAGEGSDSSAASNALVALANLFARSWAEARGEQDRINTARYVQYQQDHESWADKHIKDPILGETDYGGPPPDPPVPSPPDYAPTRQPLHPEYQYQ